MNICMAGIDYKKAGIDVRQKFTLTESGLAKIYEGLAEERDVLGSCVISTCGRTELYLSCAEQYAVHPFAMLCRFLGLPLEHYEEMCQVREGEDVFYHLCRLACGADSQIWGEDQIISQVKKAWKTARECGAIDSVLEVMFRQAVAGAKRVKTQVKFAKSEASVAGKALEILRQREEAGRKTGPILVIGNGEIGRFVTKKLLESGYQVTMTLRGYHRGEVLIPSGAKTLPYHERYKYLPEFDVVVGATASPHSVIDADMFEALPVCPSLLIDLAVPRDIDPLIGRLPGVTLYDIDSLAIPSKEEDLNRQMEEIDRIIGKYYHDFIRWEGYRGLVSSS